MLAMDIITWRRGHASRTCRTYMKITWENNSFHIAQMSHNPRTISLQHA